MKNNLSTLRWEAKLTQQQLSELSGVTQQSISKIERQEEGHSPRHDTLVKLGNALGVTVEQITGQK